ncbi:TetR/AcrR family transcriptional regulator [Riemerella anatipestifer]|uniref:TetR/AcrR family transcriptional regulator n=1 Tax=Riemerella anatipestifer TaxID=34085 RepID=UPI001BD9B71C|nr:TetR/AcrR family transcriptional regulator [Riemerella anatipestifer]MBT0551345.1 TetR/AcrR family transcriptional regulator [Riemerella anatipestifer]MBT0554728.1 TetR/AcrR family transcriptional regulator [Riemerella anatipestifer]MCE3024073.1 TetR/AcrR family transcriptional regulator [Riemerella anatipestifer]MCU7542772.1 TetR/AcrR family transcriptional regulator [Riemerella anatipestifer]MCU7560212.1 TetR/AcrR family transcriptional regulator [Riemerella anatipestifer]
MNQNFTQKQINILNAAEELIAKKGFDGVSVREIAKKAGVNIAMISYYFGSKEKMMVSLYQYRVEKTREMFSLFTQTIAKASPEVQISEMVSFIVKQMLKFNYFHGFATQEIGFNSNLAVFLQDFYELCTHRLEEAIQKGIAIGVFKKIAKSEEILASLIGTVLFAIRNQFFYKSYLPKGEAYLPALEKKMEHHLKTMIYAILGYEE